MLNQYEIVVLYDPGLELDLAKAEAKIEAAIKDAGGKITKTDNWGKRKLAYPIAKQDFAIYVFYTAEIPATGVGQIERALNITDEVIRFMITKPDLKAMAKAEALKTEKAKKAAERDEKPAADSDVQNAQPRESAEEE
ncbi:30S ribosomal protein S6 [Candidatus Saccharibacteria bacterium]|nr:30S ribosomal protein S6 [Candidatus Saccharibacteria bacterium]